MKDIFYARQLAEEGQDDQVAATAVGSGEPEYNFEGYTIAVSEKVMLIPLTPPKIKSNG